MGGGKIKKVKKDKQKDEQKASDKSSGKKQSTDMPPIGAHAGGASKDSSSGGQRKNSTQSETSFSNPEKQRITSTHQQGASSQADPKQSKWKNFKQTINPRKHQSSVDRQQDAQDVLAVTQSQSSPPQLATWSSYGNTGGGAAEVADSCFTPDSEANIHSPTGPFEKRTDEPPFLESSSKSHELLTDALNETPVRSKYPVECASSPISEEDEENGTTGAGYSTQTSETQESRIARRPRETDATLLQRQIANNKKLKDQLKALQDEFSAKRQEFQAKLNEREIKFVELNDTMKKVTEAYLTEMQTKEALFNDCAQQWEKKREVFEDEKIKLENEQRNTQEAMTRELEKQANRHKEELIKFQNHYKKSFAVSNQKHQKELTAQREQARQLELKYQTELKKERKQRDGYIEEIIDQGSPDSSPEQTRRKAKVEMEIKQQDQIQQKIADLQQENDFLKTQLTDQQQRARYLQSELEHQKEVYGQLQIQVLAKQQSTGLPTVGDVFQYQQDFEEERAAREQAIGAKDTEYGKFSMRVQTLSDQLRESKAEAETEKREKQAVIAKLETTLTEKQQLTKQLTQTEEDLDRTLATKLQEIREESTQLMAQMEHLRTESMKFQRQQQTAEATYERREAELVEYLVAIKQELSHTKQNCSRTATELQDARQRLKVSLADTECLHDEVMSKTAQVKQYKKQTDSFKDKMEEANTKLLKTQQELQRCQELINTMEMDSQDQNRERIDYLERTAVDRQSVISGLASNIRSQKQHIHQLEVEIEHQKEANGRLEARLERQDELAPYCVSQVLSLGQQEGSGSYGSIYLTQLNGINCVAKRVHDILLGHGNVEQLSLEDKRAAYKKFYSECVLLSRMRHPNIVQFMGVYYGPQRDYGRELTLVMERLYMNLYDCLHRYPNIEMWLKISILLDVSQGLLHLHSQGIVHRDLTTPNVLLTTSFHAKIADLGVSKIIQVCGTKQTTAPGNPDYMPPEALTEIPTYGYALDIFSFGVIMLFVLTQKYPKPYEVPFTVTGVQRKEIQIQKRMKWISKLSPEDPMRQLICRCLQDDPQRRPLSQELNSTLIRFAQQFPKPFVDTIEMQRKCIPTTPPIPLPRRLSQGQQ